MESIKACNVCFLTFDAKDHAPRFLPCGHSLCSQCLTGIISIPNLRKCPFDNIPFPDAQKTLASFPLNFIVMDMLEQKNNNLLCKTHPGKKLKLICLTENKKICSECAKQEGHQGHRIKKIKELKAQGAKLKGELEQKMLNLKEYELEREKDFDEKKRLFSTQMVDQLNEILKTISERHSQMFEQVLSTFNLDKTNTFNEIFVLKQQMNETIEDLTHACNDGGNLMILDKQTLDHPSVAEAQAQFLKDEISRLFLGKQKSFTELLNNYNMALNSFSLAGQKFIKEISSLQQK